MKNTFSYGASFVAIVAIVLAGFAGIGAHLQRADAQTVTQVLNGYGWSDTVGWISFNCLTGASGGGNICPTLPYSVTEDSSGNLTGYAWSDNIGWIKFGGLSGFPSVSGSTAANANLNSAGVMTGWARACAGTIKAGDSASFPTQTGDCSSMTSRQDGWDGWISLSGIIPSSSGSGGGVGSANTSSAFNAALASRQTGGSSGGSGSSGTPYGLTFSPSTTLFSGYAWGSDIVGWLTLNASGGTGNPSHPSCNPLLSTCPNPPPTPTLSATLSGGGSTGTSISVSSTTPVTLSWTPQNFTIDTSSGKGCTIVAVGTSNLVSGLTSPSYAFNTPFNTNNMPMITNDYKVSCYSTASGGPIITSNDVYLTINNPTSGGGNNGSRCVPVANATMCPYEGTATSNLNASTVVNMCSATALVPLPNSCEWTCNPGFHQVGTEARCVLNGTLKEN